MTPSTRNLHALFLALLPLIAGLGGSRFLPAGEAAPGDGLADWSMKRGADGTEVVLRWESAATPTPLARPADTWVLRQGDLPVGGAPGEPQLPFRRVRLLAPPETDLARASVDIAGARWVEWAEPLRLAPAPPHGRQTGGRPGLDWAGKDPAQIRDGRDMAVYASDEEFPRAAVEIAQVGQYREWKLVDVVIHPVRYRPLSGRVSWLVAGDVRLRLPAAAASPAGTPVAVPGNPGEVEELMKGVLNGVERDRLYASVPRVSAVCDIVLVTTRKCWTSSAFLQSWVGQRQAVGWKVRVVMEGPTEDDDHYATGDCTDSRADNIRAWLKNRYPGWGYYMVLLVGNPVPADASAFQSDISVPMKVCYPNNCPDCSAPTDMYYAELSGDSWDRNGNGVPGEWPADLGANGADRFCELNVGRIPVYSFTEIDVLFARILKYGAAYPLPASRRRVIVGGAISNFSPQDSDGDGVLTGPWDYVEASRRTFGADWGEAVRARALARGDLPVTLYEKEGCYADGSSYPLTACDDSLTKDHLAAQYAQGAGYMTLWGHGNSTGICRTLWPSDPANPHVMDAVSEKSQVAMLEAGSLSPIPDGAAPFVTLVACSNGWPEDPNNLGRLLLFAGAPGAWCAMRDTGYQTGSWTTQLMDSWADNASFGYWIYECLKTNRAGFALTRCRSEFALADLSSWYNMVLFNLYGDPSFDLEATRFPDAQIPEPAHESEWPVGSVMNIQWTTQNWPSPFVDGTVQIDLTRDQGLTWETIVPETANDGQAQWTVSAPGGDGCRLRLRSVSKPGCAFPYWNDFHIQELTVTAPVAYETWRVGAVGKIGWEAKGIAGKASVEINRNYPAGAWEPLASYVEMAQGGISWTVTGPGSGLCRVRVTSLKNPALQAYSPFFTITQLALTAPTGGETWRLQEIHNITWSSAGLTGNVRLRLLRDSLDSGTWETIAADYPNLGSYPWAVTAPVSARARIWVSSVADPDLNSGSAADFHIGGITVLSPGAGDGWVVDGMHTLLWNSVGVTGNVKIELNRAYPYGPWETLFSSVPNDGAEPWQVSGPAAANCRLRVTSVDDPTLQGVSAADFHILAAPLKIVQPNGGEVWPAGTTKTITWSSSAAMTGNVGILLNRNYPADQWVLLFPNLTNDGSEPWPVTGPVSSKCRLKVYSLANPSTYVDISNADFTICNRLDLQAPDGGELWTVGETAHISWQATEVTGNVKIELNRAFPSGPWETLFAAVPAAALGQDWPVTGPASSSCAVRITGQGDTSLPTDQSSDVFRIAASLALAVQEPHAGAYWVLGKTQLVAWDSVGAVGDVQVELQRDPGSPWELLSPGAADSGSRSVTIAGAASGQARIRVSSVANPAIAATSGAFSLIPTASLTLRSPVGGETWGVGQSREITWASSGLTGDVRVELNRDYPAGPWEMLLDQAAADGRAVWTVTGPASAACRVRLSDPLEPTVQSLSLANFRIRKPISVSIQLAKPPVVFRGVLGGTLPPVQTFLLAQDGGDPLDFTVQADAAWFQVSPGSGTIGSAPRALAVRALAESGRPWPGIRRSGLTVVAAEAANSPLTVPVNMVLTPSGDVNHDGRIDAVDLTVMNLVANGVLHPAEGPCPDPEQGDFDASGALAPPDTGLFSRYLGGEAENAIFRLWDLPGLIF